MLLYQCFFQICITSQPYELFSLGGVGSEVLTRVQIWYDFSVYLNRYPRAFAVAYGTHPLIIFTTFYADEMRLNQSGISCANNYIDYLSDASNYHETYFSMARVCYPSPTL